MNYILAYDLGTGGLKTSLFDENGQSAGYVFTDYETFYPSKEFREQRPEDWWNAMTASTRKLVKQTGVDVQTILAAAVSGHSLGVVPIGYNNELLCPSVPIWNDGRAVTQAEAFFSKINENTWYEETGNGFPAHLYSIFKIMWIRDNAPQIYERCLMFIGTKDYLNFKMTGTLCTDHSYASGSGVYSLKQNDYVATYIQASGIDAKKLPPILKSTDVIGTLLPSAAKELGLCEHVKICAGGVDNACMALGAACIENGDVYTSLGTSAWIAVASDRPVIDKEKRPYVFAHCIPGKYVSATAIFSAGNSLRWVKDNLFYDLALNEKKSGVNAYAQIDDLAEKSDCGASGLFFVPALAGGCHLDKSIHLKGGLIGLDLRHTRIHIARAVLEGISFHLRLALEVLKQYVFVRDEMLIVGGGSKSKLWRSIFANIYEMTIVTTNIGQDAGSLGAAVLAAVGSGLWNDFDQVKQLHTIQCKQAPSPAQMQYYQKLLPQYQKAVDVLCDLSDYTHLAEENSTNHQI